ncbi:MAG: PQQ-binding-like beta-propeller repeat protein [Pirellula sp.]
MNYDRLFEPIILGDKLFVGFNDSDKVVAYDLASGKQAWSYYTDGPVRLPLAASESAVYFASDDGHLYCLDAASGQLRWRFRGAPLDHRALGNRRLISAWPARGGPVIYGDQVYFASSIWPFMGTFIYALDKSTGQVIWLNDETGAQYIKQPHSAPSFAGVGPQGALLATKDSLIIPGGRSVPAVFDRNTGKQRYFELNAGGKGTGGSFVTADDTHFYVHTRLKGTRQFTLNNGVKTAFLPNEPVLHGEYLYSAETVGGMAKICAWKADGSKQWEVDGDGRGDLILAGDVLYAAGPAPGADPKSSVISAIRLPTSNAPAENLWSLSLSGQTERLIAGNGKLVAVSLEGDISILGHETRSQATSTAVTHIAKAATENSQSDASVPQIERLFQQSDAAGYAFWFGATNRSLLNSVVASAKFEQVVVVEEDAYTVDAIRRDWDGRGWYGSRATVHVSKPTEFRTPPYIANMIFVSETLSDSVASNPEALKQIYNSVRPYGGVLQLLTPKNKIESMAKKLESIGLEQASVCRTDFGVVVQRVGALPGSADWTHQYGNIANTIKSDDRLVKLPLGVLWFGGNSNEDVLPRHGHGPPEQVVGGRLILQGMNSLTARDVYTGRVLWTRKFENLGTFDVYYDATYADTPLDPAYNQVHIPGANGRGTNYVVTPEHVYIVEGNACRVLSTSTGEHIRDIALPQKDPDNPQEWGYIGVYGDVLIGGVGFAKYRTRLDLDTKVEDALLSKSKAGFGSKSLDRAASLAIVGFDRHTGKQLWQVDSKHSFWHNGIVAGGDKIYLLDRNPKTVEDSLKRRGRELPKTYRILAIDALSGTPQWEVNEGVFGTWLGYSAQNDMLLQAGASGSDRLSSEVGQGMTVYQAASGQVAWSKSKLAYSGPCILHNDLIITNANSYTESAGAFYLKDGSPKLVKNPVSGALQPWKLIRAYGCNTISASENLLTFRSGAAGYYDLLTESGTGNLGGFRSGCTSNLVAANGILNAPDLTRTCSCTYQNQSSIGLVHMPELESWTIDNAALMQTKTDRVKSLGINLGAAGDRRDANGVPWVEFPVVAGDSPSLGIEVGGNFSVYQDHPATLPQARYPWISSSGVEGLTRLKVGLIPVSPYKLKTGVPILEGEDDAEEGADGQTNISSSDLELVLDASKQVIGLRFDKINVSAASQIRSAYIQFTAHAANDEPTELTIHAEMAGSAMPFRESKNNISSRPVTSESVVWSPGPWKAAEESGELQRTPDLSGLIRQVIAHPDWKPGNAIAMILRGTGKRVATAYAKDKSGAAKLVMDAEEVSVPTNPNATKHPYRLRLLFGLPTSAGKSPRKFVASVAGESQALEIELDPSKSREVVQTIERVMLGDELDMQFQSVSGKSLLSGIEITKLEE